LLFCIPYFVSKAKTLYFTLKKSKNNSSVRTNEKHELKKQLGLEGVIASGIL
jgi:hypothetical protein